MAVSRDNWPSLLKASFHFVSQLDSEVTRISVEDGEAVLLASWHTENTLEVRSVYCPSSRTRRSVKKWSFVIQSFGIWLIR